MVANRYRISRIGLESVDLEDISTGELRIGGRRVNEVDPQGRDIAMVFQSYALYPHMSVRDNIAYGLKLRKMPKDQINARIAKAARQVRSTASCWASGQPQKPMAASP